MKDKTKMNVCDAYGPIKDNPVVIYALKKGIEKYMAKIRQESIIQITDNLRLEVSHVNTRFTLNLYLTNDMAEYKEELFLEDIQKLIKQLIRISDAFEVPKSAKELIEMAYEEIKKELEVA